MRRFVLIALIALTVPFAASAHLAGGKDITSDGYVLDFGWDPGAPVAGEPTTLAFNLADAKTNKAVAFDAVWVRIAAQDGTIAFAGTLRPKDGNVTFSTVLPAQGVYSVSARYSVGGKELDGSFDLEALARAEVSAAKAPAPPSVAVMRQRFQLFATLVLVAGCAYMVGFHKGRYYRK